MSVTLQYRPFEKDYYYLKEFNAQKSIPKILRTKARKKKWHSRTISPFYITRHA
jgi:hypothetical protein